MEENKWLDKLSKAGFELALIDEMQQVGTYQHLKQGDYLMKPGGYIRTIPILLEGSVKILRHDSEGREVLLYYLGGLETCAFSLHCCIQQKTSEVEAIAEENTRLLAIPVEKIDEWICKYPSWKAYVFASFQRRFDDLLQTIDEVTFAKLDERLMNLLRKKLKSSGGEHILYTTHEELAKELATSREVVSRILKQLERQGQVRLARNKIQVY